MKSIVKNYRGMVTKIGFDFRFSGHDLEDFIQVVFIKVSIHIDKYNQELSAMGTWIKKIATNTAIDFQRKKDRNNLIFERIYEGRDNNIHFHDNSFDFDFFDANFQNFNDLINMLSAKERDVITLKYFENCTQKEIEQKLGLSKNSGGVYLTRAINKLKVIFNERGLKMDSFILR